MAAAYVFLAVGVLVILLALIEWRKDRHLRAVGERTDGVVVDLRWSGERSYPVFRFQTPDGRVVTAKGRFGSSPPMYRPGAAVRVLYDPAEPAHARIDRAAFGTGRIIFFLAIGVLFVGVGVGLLSLPEAAFARRASGA